MEATYSSLSLCLYVYFSLSLSRTDLATVKKSKLVKTPCGLAQRHNNLLKGLTAICGSLSPEEPGFERQNTPTQPTAGLRRLNAGMPIMIIPTEVCWCSLSVVCGAILLFTCLCESVLCCPWVPVNACSFLVEPCCPLVSANACGVVRSPREHLLSALL
jgi:hypothetical protein